MQKPSQDEWNKTLDNKEDAMALEKNLSQAFLNLSALGSACADLHACDFLESGFLKEQLKLIKQITPT